jgi:YVTN family beta-propeller protein
MSTVHCPHATAKSRKANERPLTARLSLALIAALLFTSAAQLTARADGVTATIAVGANPISAAISPDGSLVYVSNNNSGSISVINAFTNTVVNTIFTPSLPAGLALTPDGTELWVALGGANSVAVYDTSTLTLHAGFPQNPIPVGSGPQNIAFKAGGGQAFVTNYFSNTVSVIKVGSGLVTNTVSVGLNPLGIAVAFNSATGVNTVFVANYGSNTTTYFNPSSLVPNTIGVGAQPYGVAATPDGAEVYVTNSGSNNMTRIDVASATVISTIATGTRPEGVVVRNSSAGFRIHVANNGSNTVMKIKPSGVILATVAVGANPVGIAALPSGNLLYVTNAGSNTVSVIDVNL